MHYTLIHPGGRRKDMSSCLSVFPALLSGISAVLERGPLWRTKNATASAGPRGSLIHVDFHSNHWQYILTNKLPMSFHGTSPKNGTIFTWRVANHTNPMSVVHHLHHSKRCLMLLFCILLYIIHVVIYLHISHHQYRTNKIIHPQFFTGKCLGPWNFLSTYAHLANGPWKKSLNFIFPTI